MKTIITKSFDMMCQFGVIILLIGGMAAGYGSDKFPGAIAGLISAFFASVLIFGILFILMEIRDNTRRTAETVARSNGDQ